MSPMHAEQTWLVAVARVTERLCGLPAVATPDWCDRAARCYLPLAERGVVAVLIGTLSPNGAIEEREAVGAAIDGPGDASGDGQLPNLIRSRADRLPGLGFPLSNEALDRGFCATADRSSIPRDWRAGPLGRMWAEIPAIELFLAGAPIGPRIGGRMVLVMIARPDASAVAQREAVLTSTLPMLGKRALLAIGGERTAAGDWLTAREQLVLERITVGMSVTDIAGEIDRSAHTVHDHVKSLHKKLNASSRGELIARALGHVAELQPKPARKKATKVSLVEGDRVEEVKPAKRAHSTER